MPDAELYELFDHLDAFKTLDTEAARDIYKVFMVAHKELFIDALQYLIIEIIAERM